MTGKLGQLVSGHSRAIVLVILTFALAGLAFIPSVPTSIFPETNFPRLIILVNNGIQPVNIQEITVTRPIEEAIRIVPGITDIRSVTARGSTEVSVFFRWDVDIMNALQQVEGRVAQITPVLPPGAQFYINRLTFSVFPMLGFSITSPTRTQADLWDLAYYDIVPRLYALPGVAENRIVGGRQPEYHVIVDPEKLNGYGISLTQIVTAIQKTNLIQPTGMIEERYHMYLTTVTGLMENKKQIADTVVAVVNGTPVRIRDLAIVEPGEKPTYNVVTADGLQAVLVNVMQQPDGNAVEIADAVNAELNNIRKILPPDIKLRTFYDQSILVRDSIGGVVESILIGLALAALVLAVFLKNWRSTLVAVTVIPISVLVAVVFMKLFNMSFNLMTLGGIAACIGVVIDDAIVMVENIIVHMSMGQEPRQAAMSAVQELTPALIGSTLTPIMVFAPLIFLGGITAVFFRALALTLVTALLASLMLAIFFTPVLSSLLLKRRVGKTAKSIEQAEQAGEGRILQWMNRHYEATLEWSLHHSGSILLAAALIMGGSGFLYLQLGSGFLPEIDEGAFVLDYFTPPGTSLQETSRILSHIEQFLQETPEIESYSRRTGARLALAIAEPNTGDFLIRLKTDRERSLQEVTSELRQKILATEPAVEVEFPHILEDLVGDLSWSPQPIEIKIYNDDDEVFKKTAANIAEWLNNVGGVVDILDRTIVIGPEVNFHVDLENAQRAGFGVQDVANLTSAIQDGVLASNMYEGDRTRGIRVRYPAKYRTSSHEMQSLLLTSPTGQTVQLSDIATPIVQSNTAEIHRENLHNLSSVTARLEGRDLGSAMAEIQDRLFQEVDIPPGTRIEFGGLYQIQQESFRGLTQVLVGSILLIFIILVVEFRSFSHPLAILSATLLCTFGSLFALWATDSTLDIVSFMGIIMVIGIVHKNGILMLDSEQHFSGMGLELKEAVLQAGRRRLRPILMTALSTICGMAPLAMGVGSGAQLLQPLAIAVIGGVTVSMLLSLVITPVLFCQLRARGL